VTSQLFGLTPQALAATDEALKGTVGVSLVDLIGLLRSGALPGAPSTPAGAAEPRAEAAQASEGGGG
jgi:hypothetical protein